jgi:predicted GIY-YIG superfamily endonuclease
MVKLLPLEEVNARTVFPGNLVPDLGLRGDPEEQFRVYVLQGSGEKYYCGVEERRFLKQRLTKQFEGRGAKWNRTHPPDGIAFLMPVAHRAAEAYVFYALLAKLPAKSLERLGGWTQTSVNPSPLVRLVAQESRRNVLGKCFTCGSGEHFADDCASAPQTCPYPCKKCGETLRLTSRGHTPSATRPAPSEPVAVEKRAVEAQAAEAEPKRPRVSRSSLCHRVRVCGVAYTTVAWYMGTASINSKYMDQVKQKCWGKAVQIIGGDSKTLQTQLFARAPPGIGKELLPGRTNLPHEWVESACASVRSEQTRGKEGSSFIQIRKASTGQAGTCRGILWRLEDLQAVLDR